MKCLTVQLATIALLAAPVLGQTAPDVSGLRMTGPPVDGRVDFKLKKAAGPVQIIVRLTDPPLAAYVGSYARRLGFRATPDQQRAYLGLLQQKQSALLVQIAALGGTELGRVAKAHNAVMVQADASRVSAIASLPGVSVIRPLVDYQLSLGSTVPYIGAAALQAAGVDGSGVTVAVLDSGIDYTHRNLGGPGTAGAYAAAYGLSSSDARNTTRDGLFPTAKVIAGYDFVGERWPNGPLAPDPDPIDFEGHGTHVADIIAGFSASPVHRGVAPGAKLVAAKVCSAVSTSCSGLALLQGIDFALDPNGDGDLSDSVDVINMSLGSGYGQREDDLSEATAVASRFGVVVVVSAGNDADRPYIVSSPSTTPEAISVAQTQVPTAVSYPLAIQSPPAIAGVYANTASLDWAPITGPVSGAVAFLGRGCPAGSIDGVNPADPFLANPAGKVALIDRGACNISLKVDRAAQAGAIGVLIGLIASGDAISFSQGGGAVFVPSLVITQSTSNLIKANIAAPVLVSYSNSATIPLVLSMVGSSARGPGYSYNSIKPDIGAPGGSVSAVAGSGTGEQAFSGTSGAAPMVAGAAALLVQAFPTATPVEIKARLMNTAEINIQTNPATLPGTLAPVSRIGGGEVRVNQARAASTAAWDAGDPASVSLSFGQYRTFAARSFQKKVVVRNYAATARTYAISSAFRYASDAASGAVALTVPPSVTAPANSAATFTVTLSVNPLLLPAWNLNGGSQGGNGALLEGVEFDGYLTISGGGDQIRLPWHILPHKAANVRPAATSVSMGGASSASLSFTNAGAVSGRSDIFSLTGSSPRLSAATLPRTGDNFAIIDLRHVGVRLVDVGGQPGLQFAVNTWGERSHPNYPAEFDIYVDSNNDGVDDFVVFNAESGGSAVSGQNVVSVYNLATNAVVTRFFADADLDSSNVIMTALLSDLGLTVSTRFRFSVYAFDNYFTGALTDALPNMFYQLNQPRFTGTGLPSGGVPAGGVAALTIGRNAAGDAVSTSQSGLLALYRDAPSGAEADAIQIAP